MSPIVANIFIGDLQRNECSTNPPTSPTPKFQVPVGAWGSLGGNSSGWAQSLPFTDVAGE